MKGLTLTQPWATLIALLEKLLETRSWATTYRGPLAIHAAQSLAPVGGVAGLQHIVWQEPFRSVLQRRWLDIAVLPQVSSQQHIISDPSYVLPRGAIVAVCTLADCRPTTGSRPGSGGPKYADWVHDLTDQERAFGNYAPERFGWFLADIRPLPRPIPCRGAQGLWSVPADVQAQIAEVIRE